MDDTDRYSSLDAYSADGIISLPPSSHRTNINTREGQTLYPHGFYNYSQSIILYTDEEERSSHINRRSEMIVYNTSSCSACVLL